MFRFSQGWLLLRPSTQNTWNRIVLLNWPGLEPLFALSDKVAQWQGDKVAVLQIPRMKALLKGVQGKSCPASYQREADLAPKETKTERIGSSSTEKPDLIRKLRRDSPFASRLKVRLGTALCNCLQLTGLWTRYPVHKSKVGQNNFCIMFPKQSYDHSCWMRFILIHIPY